MQITIQKWGNSASVRLPAALLEQLGVEIGMTLEVSISKNGLLLKPKRRPRYKLTDVLAEMPDGELPKVEGWDEIHPVGQENV